MSTILPTIPRIVFTILEPLALLAGYIQPTFDTATFVTSQLPSASDASIAPIDSTTRVLALQLGNVYGLLAMIGVAVLYSTTEPKVVRNFLIACAIADVGHVYVTYVVMGWRDFVDIGNWNAMGWGNIGITAALFVTRCLYLGGALGEDRVPDSRREGNKKNA